jgi:hypothetical protein
MNLELHELCKNRKLIIEYAWKVYNKKSKESKKILFNYRLKLWLSKYAKELWLQNLQTENWYLLVKIIRDLFGIWTCIMLFFVQKI